MSHLVVVGNNIWFQMVVSNVFLNETIFIFFSMGDPVDDDALMMNVNW